MYVFIFRIDCDTAYRLELIASTRGSNKHACLFGILNNTLTNGGRRFLRANILQPLCKQELIEERLQSVEELTNSPELLNSLQVYKITLFICFGHFLFSTIGELYSTRDGIRPNFTYLIIR